MHRAATRDDIYDFLAQDAIGPEQRLRLARWCLQNNRQSQAIKQCDQAMKMSPGNADAALLMQEIKKTTEGVVVTPRVLPPPERPHDLSPETIGRFNRAVLPTLRTSCAKSGCHNHGSGRDFEIRRAVYRSDRTATLDSVLTQIDRLQPLSSPLLIQAVTPHGGLDEAPLNGRLAPKQVENIAAWIIAAAAEADRKDESKK